jgi:hypothetical protein
MGMKGYQSINESIWVVAVDQLVCFTFFEVDLEIFSPFAH